MLTSTRRCCNFYIHFPTTPGYNLLEVLPRILQQAGTHQDATFVAAELLLVLAAVLHPAVTTSAHTTLHGAILGHCAKLMNHHTPDRRVWDLVDSPSIQLVCLILAGLKAYGGLVAAEVHVGVASFLHQLRQAPLQSIDAVAAPSIRLTNLIRSRVSAVHWQSKPASQAPKPTVVTFVQCKIDSAANSSSCVSVCVPSILTRHLSKAPTYRTACHDT